MRLAAVIVPEQAPLCRPLGNFRFVTAEPWVFTLIFYDGAKVEATIHRGFICDLYSVPKLFQFLVPKSQGSDIPALVHDYLFATVGLRSSAGVQPIVTLSEANWCLDYLMKRFRVRMAQRTLIYAAVRAGGWLPWRRLARKGHSIQNPA